MFQLLMSDCAQQLMQGNVGAARGSLAQAWEFAETAEDRLEAHGMANEIQRDICAEYIAQGGL